MVVSLLKDFDVHIVILQGGILCTIPTLTELLSDRAFCVSRVKKNKYGSLSGLVCRTCDFDLLGSQVQALCWV